MKTISVRQTRTEPQDDDLQHLGDTNTIQADNEMQQNKSTDAVHHIEQTRKNFKFFRVLGSIFLFHLQILAS